MVALVAASLAYGNVRTICKSMERLLQWMGPNPARFARTMRPRQEWRALSGFQHRWTDARDATCLVYFAGQMLQEKGGMSRFFQDGYSERDPFSSLLHFSQRALALDQGGLYGTKLPPDAGVRFFFTNPKTGACKRINMFLRWMVREDDGLDFGLWSFMSPRELIMPLDTHIFRIGRHLGWTSRRTPSFRTALDITSSLAVVAPDDPVKYDFALSRMGMHEDCPRHRRDACCELCELRRRLRQRCNAA